MVFDTLAVALDKPTDLDRSTAFDTQVAAFGKPSDPDSSTAFDKLSGSDKPMALEALSNLDRLTVFDKRFAPDKRWSVFGTPFLALDKKAVVDTSALVIRLNSLARLTSRPAIRPRLQRRRPQSWQPFDLNRHRIDFRSIHLRRHRRDRRPLVLYRSVERMPCSHH